MQAKKFIQNHTNHLPFVPSSQTPQRSLNGRQNKVKPLTKAPQNMENNAGASARPLDVHIDATNFRIDNANQGAIRASRCHKWARPFQ